MALAGPAGPDMVTPRLPVVQAVAEPGWARALGPTGNGS